MAFSELKKFVSSWRGMCILAVLVLAVLTCVPAWQGGTSKGRAARRCYRLATLEDEHRRTLAQILAGCGLLVGLYLTWRRNVRVAEETVRVAEEGHITDRFTKAIAQLGDKEMAIRLGGIYALERLAKDSEKDHGPIMEVLTAYVRENAPRQEEDPQKAAEKPPTDIQAILTVIVRRETTGNNRRNDRLDLSNTHLAGVIILGADLSEANLGGANLSGAHLVGADLSGATLGWAVSNRAGLMLAGLMFSDPGGANLSEANLGGANLSEANLNGAHLSRTFLSEADLNGADLNGADLNGPT